MLTLSFKIAVEHGKQITALKQITGSCKAWLQKHSEHKMIRNDLQPRALQQNRTERKYSGNRKKGKKRKKLNGLDIRYGNKHS
jgi:hypothetical protein